MTVEELRDYCNSLMEYNLANAVVFIGPNRELKETDFGLITDFSDKSRVEIKV